MCSIGDKVSSDEVSLSLSGRFGKERKVSGNFVYPLLVSLEVSVFVRSSETRIDSENSTYIFKLLSNIYKKFT